MQGGEVREALTAARQEAAEARLAAEHPLQAPGGSVQACTDPCLFASVVHPLFRLPAHLKH